VREEGKGKALVAMAAAAQPGADYWALGICLELTGTLLNASGKQSIKYALLTRRHAYWVLGVLLFSVLYPFLDILALNFAPASLVFSFDGMIVVWNVLLAPYTLGEPVTRSKLTAALVVTTGTICAGAFGSKAESVQTPEGYLLLLGTPSAIAFYVIYVALSLSGLFLARSIEPSGRVGGLVQSMLAGWIAGIGFPLKVCVQLVRVGAPWGPMLYLLLLLTASAQILAIYGLTYALRRHEATFVVPIYEGTMIFAAGVSGYAVLEDYRTLPVWSCVLYWVSITILLLGLYLITFWPHTLLGDGDARVPWLSCLLRDRPPVLGHVVGTSSPPADEPPRGGLPEVAGGGALLKGSADAKLLDETTSLVRGAAAPASATRSPRRA
jgi:drug/metabolite transporter (DMT)-like permease